MLKDRVILFHPGPFSLAFDVFRKRGTNWKPMFPLYEYSRCKYVAKFLSENPEFEYIGSEDFAHDDPDDFFMEQVFRAIKLDDMEVVLQDLPWVKDWEYILGY